MSFQSAIAKADAAKKSNKKLSNEQKLQLYAHYKQGSSGPCNIPKPGMFDLLATAKYNAWKALGSMSQAAAQAKYIQLVNQFC